MMARSSRERANDRSNDRSDDGTHDLAPRPALVGDREGPPLLQVADGVATLTLRRPSQRNSLQDVDLHALLAHFATVDADASVRVLVLGAVTVGQPKPVFCAGYHLGGFESGQHDPQLFERVPDALERLRPITVCALSGSVYGGATDLLLACDLRIGLAGTEFRMPAAALGLHYYPSGLRRYVSRLGIDLAKRAFLTAQALPIEALAERGIFHTVAADAQAFAAALAALVRAAATLAPLAAQLTKQSLNEMAAGRHDEAAWHAWREREARTARSEDFAEGRAAFAERRTPRFRGR